MYTLELFKIIIKGRMTYIAAGILICVAYLCAAVTDPINGLAAEQYLTNFNWMTIHFFIQYPLMLLFSIPVFAIIQNDMLRVRQCVYDRIFLTEALAAFTLSFIYSFMKTVIEFAFFSSLGGTLIFVMILVGFMLLLLTTYMVILLFFAFKAFLRSSAWSLLILTTLLGVDTATTIVYTPILPNSLMLFAIPLSVVNSFLAGDAVNVMFLLGISLLKVMLALVLFRFVTRRVDHV